MYLEKRIHTYLYKIGNMQKMTSTACIKINNLFYTTQSKQHIMFLFRETPSREFNPFYVHHFGLYHFCEYLYNCCLNNIWCRCEVFFNLKSLLL